MPERPWGVFQAVAPWPAVRPQHGVRRPDDRAVLAAILLVAAASESAWRQLPPVFGAFWRPQCEIESVRVRALQGRTMAWVNSSAFFTTSSNIALITPCLNRHCHRSLPPPNARLGRLPGQDSSAGKAIDRNQATGSIDVGGSGKTGSPCAPQDGAVVALMWPSAFAGAA